MRSEKAGPFLGKAAAVPFGGIEDAIDRFGIRIGAAQILFRKRGCWAFGITFDAAGDLIGAVSVKVCP